jgi:glycerol dehydrogenase
MPSEETTPTSREPIMLIAPSKYVQGPGAFDRMHEYVPDLGHTALLIISEGGNRRFGERLQISAAQANLTLHTRIFGGESTLAEIDAGVAAAEENGCDVIIGVGGGKPLDTAKAVGYRSDRPWVMMPTLASNDGPCSSLSVVYHESGELDHYIFIGKNPDLVIMDSQIVADASPRFLAAGMGDAVSTRFESRAAAVSGAYNVAGGRPSSAALSLGALAWDNIRTYGVSALMAVQQSRVTEALELIIETNTVHSGLGFESGGYSGAHAIHNGLTMLRETDDRLHGEKVNFGVLTQLVLERRPDAELEEYIEFSLALGLPVTLEGLGVTDITDEALERIASRTVIPGEGIHLLPFPVTAEMVAAAVASADAFARHYLVDRSPSGPNS